MQTSSVTDIAENVGQLWLIGQSGDLQLTKTSKSELVWLSKDSDKRRLYKLGQVMETIEGSDARFDQRRFESTMQFTKEQ